MENKEFNDNEIFKEAFKHLSDEENEDRLFSIQYVTEETAKELLGNNEISGYLMFDEVPKVVINTNGINETILKYVTEEVVQQETMINSIVNLRVAEYMQGEDTENIGNINLLYERINNEIEEILEEKSSNIEDVSSNNLSYTMIEFYTLIAMTCLYGGILGMTAINQNLANMSNNGKRITVSPTPSKKVILSSVLAGYITQLVGIAILFVYTIFVLKVDYGDNLRTRYFAYVSSVVLQV